MAFSALVNTPIVVNLINQAQYTGWALSADGSTAIHSSCQSGLATLISYPVTAGQSYQVSYSVPTITSGYIQMQAGGTNGAMRTTANIYVETIVPATDGFIQFFSNGNCSVTLFNAANITNQIGTTLVWSALNKKWSDFRNQYPDFGWSIYNKTVMGYQGNIYSAQNGGGTGTNNFFGTQYQSSIMFVEAANPEVIKDAEALNYQANMLLVTTIDGVKSSNGQVSTLIDTDFIKQKLAANGLTVTNYQVDNVYSASLLGDQNDENIVNGASMRGNWFLIELITVDGSTPLQLFSVGVRTSYRPIGSR